MMKMKSAIFKSLLLSLMMVANIHWACAVDQGIIPNGKATFLDQNGDPLTSGTVDFYIPGTTTRKTTYQDIGGTTPNTNPVTLDAAGRALLWGTGNYRQIVKDKNSNIIWDVTTSVASGGGGGGGTATGDGDLVGTIKPWAGMTAPNQYMFTYGQEVSRTTYSALFTAITSRQNIFCNSGSAILSGLTDTTNFWIGTPVEVSCVPGGFSTIASKTSSTITLVATANITVNTNATFFPWGRGNGSTTFNIPDFRGLIPAGNNNMGGTPSSRLTVQYFAQDPNSTGGGGGNQTAFLQTNNLPSQIPSGTVTGTASVTSTTTFTFNAGNVNVGAGANPIPIPGSNIAAVSNGNITAAFAGTPFAGQTATPFAILPPMRTTNFIIKVTPDSNSATASGVTSLGGMTGDIACGDGLLCTGNIISAGSANLLPSNNNWTGLNNFIATNGGLKLTGSPNITTGYQETPSLFGGAFDLTTISTTTPETALLINTTNSIGSGNLLGAFKRSVSVTNECNAGSASCWGQTIAALIGNGSTQRGGVGLEIDLNSFWGNYTGQPSNPYAGNLIITGQNNDGLGHGGYASCAICIEFAQNANPMWNYGIHLGTSGFKVYNTAAINDASNSPISYQILGTHTTGIDMSGATLSGGAFQSPFFAIGNIGNLSIGGTTSGTMNISVQAVAGTPTLVWPTGSGTLASNATSPILLNGTTGAISCPSCLTTAGGIITSSSANALAVGANGATNPVFQVDASIGSVVTGLKIAGGAIGNGTSLTAISSGTNEPLGLNAKGSGSIGLGTVSTGSVLIGTGGGGVTVGSALTYGGITLSNVTTGTGNLVASISPTITTPNIVGVTGGSNALAGSVGEYISSTVAQGSAIAMTSNTPINVTSISLTAGDWDVWGNVGFTTGATTLTTALWGTISTTSATFPASPGNGAYFNLNFAALTNGAWVFPTGMTRISISATTPVYLVSQASFNTSTQSVYGFIGARRIR